MPLMPLVRAIIAQAQESGGTSNTVIVLTAVLSMMGLVLVALITGIFNWLQSRQAHRATKAAAVSAASAADYAAAIEAKSATIDALEEQVATHIARHEQDDKARAEERRMHEEYKAEMRRRLEECEMVDQAHSLLERDWARRIEELEAHFGRRNISTDGDRDTDRDSGRGSDDAGNRRTDGGADQG